MTIGRLGAAMARVVAIIVFAAAALVVACHSGSAAGSFQSAPCPVSNDPACLRQTWGRNLAAATSRYRRTAAFRMAALYGYSSCGRRLRPLHPSRIPLCSCTVGPAAAKPFLSTPEVSSSL